MERIMFLMALLCFACNSSKAEVGMERAVDEDAAETRMYIGQDVTISNDRFGLFFPEGYYLGQVDLGGIYKADGLCLQNKDTTYECSMFYLPVAIVCDSLGRFFTTNAPISKIGVVSLDGRECVYFAGQDTMWSSKLYLYENGMETICVIEERQNGCEDEYMPARNVKINVPEKRTRKYKELLEDVYHIATYIMGTHAMDFQIKGKTVYLSSFDNALSNPDEAECKEWVAELRKDMAGFKLFLDMADDGYTFKFVVENDKHKTIYEERSNSLLETVAKAEDRSGNGAKIINTEVFSISIPDGWKVETDTLSFGPDSYGYAFEKGGKKYGILRLPIGVTPEAFPLETFADSTSHAVGEETERMIGGKMFRSQLFDNGKKMVRVNHLSEDDNTFFLIEESEDGELDSNVWADFKITEQFPTKSMQERLNNLLQVLNFTPDDGESLTIESNKVVFQFKAKDDASINKEADGTVWFSMLVENFSLFKECAKMGYDFMVRVISEDGKALFEKTVTAEDVLDYVTE